MQQKHASKNACISLWGPVNQVSQCLAGAMLSIIKVVQMQESAMAAQAAHEQLMAPAEEDGHQAVSLGNIAVKTAHVQPCFRTCSTDWAFAEAIAVVNAAPAPCACACDCAAASQQKQHFTCHNVAPKPALYQI